MKSIRHHTLHIFLVGLIVSSCAPNRKNPLSQGFHNTTAHYNAYFIANENIKGIEASLASGYQWNYNKVLPVYIEFDTTDTKQFEDQLKETIEKASISIQRHPGSAWEDDSYILVGKARFYGFEFQDAVETFKYVNTHSKNDNARHEALINLMHTFIKNNEINNAIAVSDYLKREDLNKNNLKDLYLNRAYLNQRRENPDKMVSNLVKAEEDLRQNKLRARINFMIAQIYQELGFDAEAYNNYRKVLRYNPSYELSFYTKLNMAQVSELANTNDTKKIRKYFKKLLSDEKNLEYKDKIYYEIGNFELKQGNLDEAIIAYKESTSSSVNNQRQKGYSFWQLGKIYYDSLRDYQLAKNYYDSTISVLPKDEEAYEDIAERQQILEEFVKQITIIDFNDSLLTLSRMDTASLYEYLDDYIAEQKQLQELANEKRKRSERRQALAALNSNEDIIQIGTKEEGVAWYFYNTSAISKGRSEFKRLFGDRILEDNWRRSSKQITQTVSEKTDEKRAIVGETTSKSDANQSQSSTASLTRESLLSTIPNDTATTNQLLREVETAHYDLGKIYHFQLQEDLNAIITFDTMLFRFPISTYKPEVLYLLFLMSKESDSTKAFVYSEQLASEFPNSIYAKLTTNPNYREESQAIKAKLERIYKEAYQYYQTENLKKSLSLVTEALSDYPDNVFSDNMALLKVLVIGKMETIYKYQFELSNFIKSYEDSELIPYAEKLLKTSEEFQLNLVNSSKAKFYKNLNKEHQMVVAYQSQDNASTEIPAAVEGIIKNIEESDNVRIANMILSKEYAFVLINDFKNKAEALKFFTKFQAASDLENSFKSQKFVNFVITEDNFNILYQTKELDSYKKFFERNYNQAQ